MEIRIFLLLFFLFLINIFYVDALKLTLSPSNTTINSVINEETCKKITIYSDKSINMMIEDKWKINGKSSNIKDYNLNSKDINVNISYPKNITTNNQQSINFCIKPEKIGSYNGVLLFKSTNNPIGIGSLIELNVFNSHEEISSQFRNYNNSNKITGEIVKDEEIEKEGNFNLGKILVINSIFLISLFLIILKINISNKNKYNEKNVNL